MEKDIQSVLISEEELKAKVKEIGGCFIFSSDLVRSVSINCSMYFMAVSTYRGTKTTGAVKINKDLSEDICGKDVIIVEDILDSGITLNYLKHYLMVRQPASIRIVTLMDKPSRRKADVYADYSCFEVPDAFVVGYGLDYNEQYRNLPYVGILKPEVYM